MNDQNLEFYLPNEIWTSIFDKINLNYNALPLHIKFVCKNWYNILKSTKRFSKNNCYGINNKNYSAAVAYDGNLNLLQWIRKKG